MCATVGICKHTLLICDCLSAYIFSIKGYVDCQSLILGRGRQQLLSIRTLNGKRGAVWQYKYNGVYYVLHTMSDPVVYGVSYTLSPSRPTTDIPVTVELRCSNRTCGEPLKFFENLNKDMGMRTKGEQQHMGLLVQVSNSHLVKHTIHFISPPKGLAFFCSTSKSSSSTPPIPFIVICWSFTVFLHIDNQSLSLSSLHLPLLPFLAGTVHLPLLPSVAHQTRREPHCVAHEKLTCSG